jgi:ankyrin repeat protein
MKKYFTLGFFLLIPAMAEAVKMQCTEIRQLTGSQLLENISHGKIRALMQCGLQINAPITVSVDGEFPVTGDVTPLQFAAAIGDPALVKQLIDAGANPNFGGADREAPEPPLDVALSQKRYQAARVLIDNKANTNYGLPVGWGPLHTLAFDIEFGTDAQNMAHYLVEHGADIDGADLKGGTPLHWAAFSGNFKYAQTLMAMHSDPCIRNKRGLLPIDVVKDGHPEIAQLLKPLCK